MSDYHFCHDSSQSAVQYGQANKCAAPEGSNVENFRGRRGGRHRWRRHGYGYRYPYSYWPYYYVPPVRTITVEKEVEKPVPVIPKEFGYIGVAIVVVLLAILFKK